MTTTIQLEKVPYPLADNSGVTVPLTDETMQQRKKRVLEAMKAEAIDTLVIYGDLEHGSNFSYLTGFVTRFEESLLILHQTGQAFLVLGNENTKMCQHSRIKAELLHCPFFSLPDQPMTGEQPLEQIFQTAGITSDSMVGVVGWKLFTSEQEENRHLFELPSYLVNSIQSIVGEGKLENRTDLFIHPGYGVRTVNNANEIAHYEFGSSLASDCVLATVAAITEGKSEMELASHLLRYGQNPTVVPIVATGERFQQANIYPSNKQVVLGDRMSITTGYKGGLASRSGYAVQRAEELPLEQQDYLDQVAIPYFGAVTAWLEHIDVGIAGKELYQTVEAVLPKTVYGWQLNPGHLTADEEWLSSPVKKDSDLELQSGMLFQLDIIPSVKGYGGAGCENGIALADEELRQELAVAYPGLWQRMLARRRYIMETLHISLPDAVLPLSSGVAFYNPFFLDKQQAFVKQDV